MLVGKGIDPLRQINKSVGCGSKKVAHHCFNKRAAYLPPVKSDYSISNLHSVFAF